MIFQNLRADFQRPGPNILLVFQVRKLLRDVIEYISGNRVENDISEGS